MTNKKTWENLKKFRNRLWWNGKLIKYKRDVQNHKKCLFEKFNLSQVTVKQSTVFFFYEW